MRTSALLPLSAVCVVAALASGCERDTRPLPPSPQPVAIDPATLTVFAPLPASVAAPAGAPSTELVDLGRMLYFEPRLSKNQKISCNSCHDLAKYGVDGLPTSEGHKGLRGSRNAPTVYQRLGLVKPFPRDADTGRMQVTKDAVDQASFKVPSLRNIEKTGPYFHDGGTTGLEQAVKDMAEYQLGRALTDAQVAQIITFLKVLAGDLDADYSKRPTLPASTPSTPKAEDGD